MAGPLLATCGLTLFLFGAGARAEEPALQLMPSRPARAAAAVCLWGRARPEALAGGSGAARFAWELTAGDAQLTVSVLNGALEGPVPADGDISLVIRCRQESDQPIPLKVELALADLRETQREWTTIIVHPQRNAEESTHDDLDIDRRIALERGLRWLYRQQNADGSWGTPDTNYGPGLVTAATATAVWAFSNAGYTLAGGTGKGPYEWAVQRAVQTMTATAEWHPVGQTPFGPADSNNNGRGLFLGGRALQAHGTPTEGYTCPMVLTALATACGNDDRLYGGVLENQGQGTAVVDVLQDAADFSAWCLGTNRAGGWSYSFAEDGTGAWRDRADLSVSSWHWIALEALGQREIHIPDWVAARSETLLTRTRQDDGSFMYGTQGEWITPATTAGALSGLAFVHANGRTTGDAMRGLLLRAIHYTGKHWHVSVPGMEWDPWCVLHGNGYNMWTVTRALRGLGLEHLPGPNGMFDWQRNRSPSGPETEGVWPYLLRTQADDGTWTDLEPQRGRVLCTAWCLLCLADGVAEPPRPDGLTDLTAEAHLAEGVSTQEGGVAATVGTTSAERRDDGMHILWSADAVGAGTAAELVCTHALPPLTPNSRAPVIRQTTVSYTRGEATRTQILPELAVTTMPWYSLTFSEVPELLRTGERVRFRLRASLPPGQAAVSFADPGVGRRQVLSDMGPAGPVWTWAEISPVLPGRDVQALDISVRAAPTLELLEDASFSPPFGDALTALGNIAGPAIQMQRHGVGTGIEPLHAVRIYAVGRPARIQLDLRDAAGGHLATLGICDLQPADYGTQRDVTIAWTVAGRLPIDVLAVATICEGTQEVARAEQQIAVSRAEALWTASLGTDRTIMPATAATITSTVTRNTAPADDTTAMVTVTVRNAAAPADDGTVYHYVIGTLAPGDTDRRTLTWDATGQAAGRYVVTQTVESGPVTTRETRRFTLLPSLTLGEGLQGKLAVIPSVVDQHMAFAVEWELENNGNAPLLDLKPCVRIVRGTAPASPESRLRDLACPAVSLDRGARGSDRWPAVPAKGMPFGTHLVLLDVTDADDNPHTVAVTRLEARDMTPPITTHDCAVDGVWTNTPRTVTFTAQDPNNGSGIKDIVTRVNDGDPSKDTVVITRDGKHTVTYGSTDLAGNAETVRSLNIWLDQTPPHVNGDTVPTSTGMQCRLRTARDDGSGVAETWITIDGGEKHTGTGVVVTESGDHTVVLAARDRAGNIGTHTLDLSVPVPADADEPTATPGGTASPPSTVVAIEDTPAGVLPAQPRLGQVPQDTQAPKGSREWEPQHTATPEPTGPEPTRPPLPRRIGQPGTPRETHNPSDLAAIPRRRDEPAGTDPPIGRVDVTRTERRRPEPRHGEPANNTEEAGRATLVPGWREDPPAALPTPGDYPENTAEPLAIPPWSPLALLVAPLGLLLWRHRRGLIRVDFNRRDPIVIRRPTSRDVLIALHQARQSTGTVRRILIRGRLVEEGVRLRRGTDSCTIHVTPTGLALRDRGSETSITGIVAQALGESGRLQFRGRGRGQQHDALQATACRHIETHLERLTRQHAESHPKQPGTGARDLSGQARAWA